MATKRRRVWVVLNDDGDVCMATLHASEARVAAADARADGHSQRAICTVERLPGDVVLSRETHKKIEADLVNAHDAWVRGDDVSVKASVDAALALLRGRR